MTIQSDVRKPSPGKLIDLFILDLNPVGINQKLYLHSGVNSSGGDIVFQGDTYSSFPIDVSGFEKSAKGSEKRPKVVISNYMGIITQYIQSINDLVGARVIRKRTLTKYLGTGSVDETVFYEDEYIVEQKVAETALSIELDLSSPLDFINKKLPARVAITNSCPWSYKSAINGSGCGWPGTDSSKWFDRNDTQVFTQQEDVCSQKLSGCKKRFGESEPLDFGGFPSLGRI